MDAVKHLTQQMMKALSVREHEDPHEAVVYLGDDSPMRSQIALDILSKAIDKNKLVRVQRPCTRNGKTFMTFKWVLPSKVKKGDVIIQNKGAYDKFVEAGGDAVELGASDKTKSGPLAKLNAKKQKAAAGKKIIPKKKPEAKPQEKQTPKKPEPKPPEKKQAANGGNTKVEKKTKAEPEKNTAQKPEQEAETQAAAVPKAEKPKQAAAAEKKPQLSADELFDKICTAIGVGPDGKFTDESHYTDAIAEIDKMQDAGEIDADTAANLTLMALEKNLEAMGSVLDELDDDAPLSEQEPNPQASAEELFAKMCAQIGVGTDETFEDDVTFAEAILAIDGMKAAGEIDSAMVTKLREMVLAPTSEFPPPSDTSAGDDDAPKPEEPQPETELQPQPDPEAEEEPEPEPDLPDIFSAGYVQTDEPTDHKFISEIYKAAGLEQTDNLASSASLSKAAAALQDLKKTQTYLPSHTIQYGMDALIKQHLESKLGKEKAAQLAGEYAGTEAAKFYRPEVIAAAVDAWQNGDHAAIRELSVSHNNDTDPVHALYSKCLTDMIRHSKTTQQGTLYRGLHVSPGFIATALQDGTLSTKGLVSTSQDAETARKCALKTGKDEVSVILELPGSLKMKTLELDGESLLSAKGQLNVKHISKDADGIYHVQLMPKGSKPDGPVADDGIYSELGVQKPGEMDQKLPAIEGSQIDAAAYKQIMAYATGVSKDKYGKLEVQNALQLVYNKYGNDGAVAVLTEYARTAVKENEWTQRYENSETGYDPKLMEMVHHDWIHFAYGHIRKMEKSGLGDKSNGSDVYHKVCSDVLNSIVEKDGQEQPGMLYRGMRPYGESMQTYVEADIGTEITLGGIASFSATGSVADKFAGSYGIVLRIPKGAKIRCAYVAGLGHENEYVVRDAKFQVSKREKKGGRIYLTLAPA